MSKRKCDLNSEDLSSSDEKVLNDVPAVKKHRGMDHQSTPSNSGDLNDVCSSGDENSDDEEDSISEGLSKVKDVLQMLIDNVISRQQATITQLLRRVTSLEESNKKQQMYMNEMTDKLNECCKGKENLCPRLPTEISNSTSKSPVLVEKRYDTQKILPIPAICKSGTLLTSGEYSNDDTMKLSTDSITEQLYTDTWTVAESNIDAETNPMPTDVDPVQTKCGGMDTDTKEGATELEQSSTGEEMISEETTNNVDEQSENISRDRCEDISTEITAEIFADSEVGEVERITRELSAEACSSGAAVAKSREEESSTEDEDVDITTEVSNIKTKCGVRKVHPISLASPLPIQGNRYTLPSSEIKASLHSINEVLWKYLDLIEEERFSSLAGKLALEAVIGEDLLKKCTPMGKSNRPGLPADSLYTIKKAIFSTFPKYWDKPEEFEKIWQQKCILGISCVCSRLRNPNPRIEKKTDDTEISSPLRLLSSSRLSHQSPHLITTTKKTLPSSTINRTGLISIDKFMSLHSDSIKSGKYNMAYWCKKLAMDAIFGPEILTMCSPFGGRIYNGLPIVEMNQLKQAVLKCSPSFWDNLDGFEEYWNSVCIKMLAKLCSDLKKKSAES